MGQGKPHSVDLLSQTELLWVELVVSLDCLGLGSLHHFLLLGRRICSLGDQEVDNFLLTRFVGLNDRGLTLLVHMIRGGS